MRSNRGDFQRSRGLRGIQGQRGHPHVPLTSLPVFLFALLYVSFFWNPLLACDRLTWPEEDILAAYSSHPSGRSQPTTNNVTVLNYTIEVSFTGGGSSCLESESCKNVKGVKYSPDFACGNADGTFFVGNWDDGVASFPDPVSSNGLVVGVDVMLYGQWSYQVATSGIASLDDVFVGFWYGPLFSHNETCPNCGIPVHVPSCYYEDGWPNYRRGQVNSIQVLPAGDNKICLTKVVITLIVVEQPPTIQELLPPLGPADTKTVVTVNTENSLADASSLHCRFGSSVVTAVLLSPFQALCGTPKGEASSVVPVSVTEDGNVYSEDLSFYYYQQPQLESLSPPSGSIAGHTKVTITGGPFLNTSNVTCEQTPLLGCTQCLWKYNSSGASTSVSTAGVFVNERTIYCYSPPLTNLTTDPSTFSKIPRETDVVVVITVTMNSQVYTPSELAFNYSIPPPSWTGYFWPLIVIASLIVVFVGVLAVSTWRWKRNRQGEMEISSDFLVDRQASSSDIPVFTDSSSLLLSSSATVSQRPFPSYMDASSPASINNNPRAGSPIYVSPKELCGSLRSEDFCSSEKIDPEELTDFELLGRGSVCVLYNAMWKGSHVVIKRLPLAPRQQSEQFNDLLKEANIMRGLRHPNVLQYLGICWGGPFPSDVGLVMEYMSRGSLYEWIHSPVQFDVRTIRRICEDTAKGMWYLHSRVPPIIHRDLKSHNLLLDENLKVKVCDFGLSCYVRPGVSPEMTACGTPSWSAPEVLRSESYTMKADVYSFGVVLWELFARGDPYPGLGPMKIAFEVSTMSARPALQQGWPLQWTQLMELCWSENPAQRPDFKELLELFPQ